MPFHPRQLVPEDHRQGEGETRDHPEDDLGTQARNKEHS